MDLRCIELAGTSRYRATISSRGDSLVFLFRVEVHDGIQAVGWDADFNEFLNAHPDFALTVLPAVSAFHEANKA